MKNKYNYDLTNTLCKEKVKNKDKYDLNNLSIEFIDKYPRIYANVYDVANGWNNELYTTNKKLSFEDAVNDVFKWLESGDECEK